MHVIEGRKIEGVQVNPVVKVVCGRDTNGTNSQKATNNPYFDKVSSMSAFMDIRTSRDMQYKHPTCIPVHLKVKAP